MKPRLPLLGAAFVAALCLIPLSATADSTAVVDLTSQLTGQVDVDGLSAIEVGGIVILRGRTTDLAIAQRAGALTQNLGYTRIANLIQIVTPPDDAAIARQAERRLAMHRALDGCRLRVDSNKGVVTVAGRVNQELQKDIAVDLVRQIDGVRSVRSDLSMNRSY